MGKGKRIGTMAVNQSEYPSAPSIPGAKPVTNREQRRANKRAQRGSTKSQKKEQKKGKRNGPGA